MSVKLIALDLDGTTLRSDKSLSPRTEKALAEAIARDINVVIATGRCKYVKCKVYKTERQLFPERPYKDAFSSTGPLNRTLGGGCKRPHTVTRES